MKKMHHAIASTLVQKAQYALAQVVESIAGGAAWSKVMTSRWLPSRVSKTVGQILLYPSLIFGARAL
jgi:hypothetical protein